MLPLMLLGVGFGFSLPAVSGNELTRKDRLLAAWEATRSADKQIRHKAICDLEEFGSQAVPLLMEIWHHGDPNDANAVGPTLARLKPRSKVIAAELKKDLLSNPDTTIRESAAIALGGVKGDEDDIVDGLVAALKDKERMVAYWAVISLQSLGQPAKRACPALAELVKVSREKQREGPPVSDLAVAIHAVDALAELDPKGFCQTIVDACADAGRRSRKDYEIMINTVIILGKMGKAANSALPLLVEIADEDKGFVEVRKEALVSINKILKARLPKE
jgi:HEAT repeats